MKKINLFRFITFLVFGCVLSRAHAFTEIVNRNELRNRLGSLTPSANLSNIKIAVLDNGFAGFIPGKGMLPDSAELIEGPLKYPQMSAHGLGMAQILWAMTGQSVNGPKIYLVNTNGFTNFKAAVDFVIANDVDIVLYSQVWLFGSNFDGKGFINEVVNKAVDKGIIWINAAGNLGRHVHSGNVYAAAQVFKIKNKIDENNFTLTLAWNNFGDSELDCAVKDLDFELLDARDNVVDASRLVQKGQSPDPKDPTDPRSCYARETISAKSLERGDYKIRVFPKSTNFGYQDKFKVIITDDRPESIEFSDHTVGNEIMPPADNARVITIGDKSALSSQGPTIDGRIKPDFLIEKSQVAFTNGNLTQGSSNAAAMMAGTVAVMKSLNKDLTAKQLLAYAESARQQYLIPNGLITPVSVPAWAQRYVPAGGTVRLHPVNGRAIIFMKEHPLDHPRVSGFHLFMIREDDIVACTEFLTSCGIYPRTQDTTIGPPLIEFRSFIKGSNGSTPSYWKSVETIFSRLPKF